MRSAVFTTVLLVGASALLLFGGCQKKAAAPPPAAKSAPVSSLSAPLSAGPGDGGKSLLVRTDDPKVFITGLLRDGVMLPVDGQGRAEVRTRLAMDEEGIECDSAGFEVRTSNAIIFRPLINLCEANWVLNVPTHKPDLPAPPPPANEEFVWTTGQRDEEDGSRSQTLVYGIPDSDGVALFAACQPGLGRVKLNFVGQAVGASRIDVVAPDRLLRYDLKINPALSEEQGPTSEVELTTGDALWVLLRRGGRLAYRFDAGPFLMADASLGAETITKFLDVCDRKAAAPPR